jgi:glutathione S-transferase
MKLFYSPGACSLSPHIVAREAGLDVQLQKVDLGKHAIDAENDYYKLNPKGYVPALEVKPGELLTEGPAIVQYLGDQNPQSGLMPAAGTMDRYRQQEMLGFINSEIHKAYSPLFSQATPEATREDRKQHLRKRYKLLDERLAGKDYLFGDKFTAADAYLFTVTNWAPKVKVDLADMPNIAAFQKRVAARPAVQAAMREEGLLK